MRRLLTKFISSPQAFRSCPCFCVLIFGSAFCSAFGQTTHTANNATELEAALSAAVTGDIISITGTISPSQQIVISKAVTVQSSADGVYRAISGTGVSGESVFKVTGAATLRYLAFSSASSGAVEATKGTFENCTFSNNSAGSGNGGAINVTSGSVSADWCTFTNNSARDRGGAIYNRGSLTINHSKFQSNSATIYFGGAIGNDGTLYLYNSELKSNSAPGGGAIYNNKTITIRNCDVTSNVATNSLVGGGGIYADSGFNLQNTKVRSNSPNQLAGTSPTVTTSNIQSDATHDLGSATSVNVDAGTSSYWVGKVESSLHNSFQDVKREQGSAVDIGAYESGNLRYQNFNLSWSVSPEGAATLAGTNFEDGTYFETTNISLNPTPGPGQQFLQWTGTLPPGKTATTFPLTFAIDANYVNLVAEFESTPFTVTLNPSQTWIEIANVEYNLTGQVNGGSTSLVDDDETDANQTTTTGTYPFTSTITAQPSSGYYLNDWWIQNDQGVDVNATDSPDFNATDILTLTYEANWTVTPRFSESLYDITLIGTDNDAATTIDYNQLSSPNGLQFQGSQEVNLLFEPLAGAQLAYFTFTNRSGQEVNATTLLDSGGLPYDLDKETGTFTFTLGGDLGINLTIKAYFEPISYSITTTEIYKGELTYLDVEMFPISIFGAPGELLANDKYTQGTVLKLEAFIKGEPNQIEVVWQDNKTTSTSNPHYVSMTEDLEMTVTYKIKRYNFTQKVLFGDDNTTFVELVSKHSYGDEVNSTTQYDAAGFDFNGTFLSNGMSAPTSFTMTDDVTLTTRFTRKLHLVTTEGMTEDANGTLVSGGGTVTVKPSLLEFEHGQQIQLQADPESSYQFDHWELSGLQSQDDVLWLTVDAPLSVIAVFVPRQYRYEFFSEPRTGGSWTANNILFGDGATTLFTHDDELEIQAAPASGYDINGTISIIDSDGKGLPYTTLSANNKKISLTVDSNATVSAVFSKDYRDSDGDGLDNYAESIHGSDHYMSDTDGDGMDDYWEVTYLLNPIDALDAADDDDYDGLTNLQEYQSGTLPRDPDSDSDGYVDVYNPKDAGAALLAGYHFVSIQVVPLSAGVVRGEGAYEDNSTVFITIREENPGYIFVNWQGDLSGSDRNGTILVDSNKTIIANFSFDNRDTDGDGLDNYTEGLYGTDLNNVDTDGDGIRDDVEITAAIYVADLNVSGVFNPTTSDTSFFAFLDSINLSSAGSSAGSSGGSIGSSSGDSLLYDFINGWFYTSAYGWSFATSSSDSVYNSRVSTWLSFQKDGDNALQLYKWDYPSKQWVDYGTAGIAGQYNLTVTKNADAGGEVSASSTYASGTNVTIQAIPNAGYHFIGWEGDVVSSSAAVSFVIDKNVSVQAIFLTDAELSSLLGGTLGN